jgi:hypothetical protein
MKKLFLLLAAAAFTQFTTFAQPGSPMSGSGAAMSKFFGKNNNFSAKCDMKATDASGKDIMSGTMNLAMLGDKVRSEIDMSQMTSSKMPPGAADSMKKMGLAQVVSIVRVDQKMMYMIYPGMKSYAKMPLPLDEASITNKEPKIEMTKLGDETIDGHKCVKNKAVFTADNGTKISATLWNATDMKDFPIQIQTDNEGMNMLMHYKDIQFTKPDAALFEPPAGYTAYDDIQKMMMSAMQKMMKDMKPPQ